MNTIEKALNLNLKYQTRPEIKDQLVNKAILWGRKIAKEKPLGEQLDRINKQAFKEELNHLSKDEILEKILAHYLRDQK